MSDIKKYYYLKLKENFFEKDNIKILESMDNGYIYSNIIMKLFLKSLKFDGKLMMTDRIPYSPDNINILAKVIGHDMDHVKEAIRKSVELDIMTIFDTGEMFLVDIQNYIGKSSSEADRKRQYRLMLDNNGQMSGQISDKTTPELELELELKKERKEKKKKIPPSLDELKNHLIEKKVTSFTAEQFFDFYQSKNWFVGKNKMVDWKSAVSTWIRRDNSSAAPVKSAKELAVELGIEKE